VATYICYAASMVRTTIFLSSELHEKLRRDAFQAKISMAELIRTKLADAPGPPRRRRPSKDPILKVAGVCRGPVLSSDIDESLYGR
jgi:hypothetical protein